MFALREIGQVQCSLIEKDYLEALARELRRRMGASFDRYDFVVWSHLGGDMEAPYLGDKPCARRVLLWISDETSSVPRGLTNAYSCTFKAYLPREYPDEGIFALSLGYGAGLSHKMPAAVGDRGFSVCFSGCPHANRLEFGTVLAILATAADPSRAIDVRSIMAQLHNDADISIDLSNAIQDSYIKITPRFHSGLTGDAYSDMLHSSKIALCPGGWLSQETFRHYEAMRAGCIVLSGPLPATRLYKNSPIVCLDSWQDLMPTVRHLLSNPSQLGDLQNKTMAWWANVCSESAQAKYIADVLDTAGGRLGLSRSR